MTTTEKLLPKDMPEEIFAYHDKCGTGTWIDFDDSCHKSGDVATRYIRADLVTRAPVNAPESDDQRLKRIKDFLQMRYGRELSDVHEDMAFLVERLEAAAPVVCSDTLTEEQTAELRRPEGVIAPVGEVGDDIRPFLENTIADARECYDKDAACSFDEHCAIYLDKALRTHGHFQGWQDISTAPRNGTRFLFTTESGYVSVGFYINGKHFAADSLGGEKDTTPTLWQKITPPSGGEGK